MSATPRTISQILSNGCVRLSILLMGLTVEIKGTLRLQPQVGFIGHPMFRTPIIIFIVFGMVYKINLDYTPNTYYYN